MPGRGTRLLGLAGAVVLILALAGCGSSGGGEIPRAAGEEMLDTVSRIEQATASDDCDTAQPATTELRSQVDALEGEIDEETYDALSQMVSRLDQELDDECVPTGPTGEDEEETTSTTAPVEPSTPETSTTPPPTEESPPEEDEEDDEDDEDGGPPVQPPGQGGAPPGQDPDGPPGGGTPSGGIEEEDE